jgi:hypothetical protein
VDGQRAGERALEPCSGVANSKLTPTTGPVCLTGVVPLGGAPDSHRGGCSLSRSSHIDKPRLGGVPGNMCLAAADDQIELRDCDGGSAQ